MSTVNIRQHLTTSSLQLFLASILYGLIFTSLITGGRGVALFICVLSVAILALRHLGDWIVVTLGVIVGIVLAILLGWQFPDVTLIALFIVSLLV